MMFMPVEITGWQLIAAGAGLLLALYLLRQPLLRVLVALLTAVRGLAAGVQRYASRATELGRRRAMHRFRRVLQGSYQRRERQQWLHLQDLLIDQTKYLHQSQQDFNALAAKLSDQLDEAAKPIEVLPDWADAMAAIAVMEQQKGGSRGLLRILEDMMASVERQHQEVMREQRWLMAVRHRLLSKMRPQWRNLESHLNSLERQFKALRDTLEKLDQYRSSWQNTRQLKQLPLSHLVARPVLWAAILAGCVAGSADLWGWLTSAYAAPELAALGGESAILHVLALVAVGAWCGGRFDWLASADKQRYQVFVDRLAMVMGLLLSASALWLIASLRLSEQVSASALGVHVLWAGAGVISALLLPIFFDKCFTAGWLLLAWLEANLWRALASFAIAVVACCQLLIESLSPLLTQPLSAAEQDVTDVVVDEESVELSAANVMHLPIKNKRHS